MSDFLYEIGDRVILPSGRHGSVKNRDWSFPRGGLRIVQYTIEMDTGGVVVVQESSLQKEIP